MDNLIITPLEGEKYKDYINKILHSRINIKDDNNYQEKHHILPKCLNGSDSSDNLIYLYAQEHYYAHKLLALENPDVSGLQYAWWNMCHCKKDGRIYSVTPEEYEEARKRFANLISAEFSGENAYWYGKTQSEDSNLKRSITETGEGNPMYGKHHTDAVKTFISDLNKGKRTSGEHPRARKVKCVETGEVFNTAQDAATKYSLKNRSSVTMCCLGDTKSAGKHPETGEKLHWEYFE